MGANLAVGDVQVDHQEIYSIVEWPEVGIARCVRYPGSFRLRGRLLADRPPPELGEFGDPDSLQRLPDKES